MPWMLEPTWKGLVRARHLLCAHRKLIFNAFTGIEAYPGGADAMAASAQESTMFNGVAKGITCSLLTRRYRYCRK